MNRIVHHGVHEGTGDEPRTKNVMRFSDFSVFSVNSVVKQIAAFTTEDTELTEESKIEDLIS